LSPENCENSLDSGRFDLGEAQIGHRIAQAAPRAISRALSCRRHSVQRLESLPAALSLPPPAISTARRLTGLGPFPFFFRRSSPFRPNTLQSDPSALPGGSSFGRAVRSDPTRSPVIGPRPIFLFSQICSEP
ncbi:hypothetical protein CRG98_001954, partial [Punica granatum]